MTQRPLKYARPERERRFLLARPPALPDSAVVSRITDRYLEGARLRLRREERLDDGSCAYKLTQKLTQGSSLSDSLITTIYLEASEYESLSSLPAAVLEKTRSRVPPFVIDAFGTPLEGLVLAEAELASDEEARSLEAPPESVAEVTADPRFSGGRLAAATREEMLGWLSEHGVTLS